MPSFSSRSSAHAVRVAPALAALCLVFAGAACADNNPLATPLSPEGAEFSRSATLSVSPANDTVLVGQTITLTAKHPAAGRRVSWTSSDTTVATVVSSGVARGAVTGRKPGVVTITASSNGRSATASVRVSDVPVRAVTISPDSASLERGDSVQFVATARDSIGQPLAGRTFTWASADTTIATVSASGVARAGARGTTQIRATSEGVTGSARLVVRVPQLIVPTIASVDTAKAGDTLFVRYSVQNVGDTPNADSIMAEVGLRSPASGIVYRAVRRRFWKIVGGAVVGDTARIVIPLTVTPGSYELVAYIDCRDTQSVNEVRLANCLASPATAGNVNESVETDNSRSVALVVRAP